MRNLLVLVVAFLFSGCAMLEGLPFMRARRQIVESAVYKENLDTDRLVDLVIVKKLTGKKILGMFSRYDEYLEGYIRGVVVDYDDNPIEGVVVRVADKGRDLPGFDPGISDANGVYRIRFSLSIKKNRVDQRGTIAYNPPWQQQLEILGAAFEPQTKETKFRLFYDRKIGIIGIGEDLPKTITSKKIGTVSSTKTEEKKAKPAEQKSPVRTPPVTPATQKPKEDFFQGFGDFGR